jgi:hypothetical protein
MVMKQVNIHQAKTELSKLVERAEAGGSASARRGARRVAPRRSSMTNPPSGRCFHMPSS